MSFLLGRQLTVRFEYPKFVAQFASEICITPGMRRHGTTTRSDGKPSTRTGIVLVICGLTLAAVTGAIMKLLSGQLHPVQITWFRFLGFALILILPVAVRFGRSVLRPARPAMQVIRGASLAAATVSFVVGARTIDYADAIAIYDELLNDDHHDAMDALIAEVLRVDPNAGDIVKRHVGIFNGDDLIAYLHEMKKKYPGVTWVAEIARDIPNLATVGDLRDQGVVDRLTKAMHELGGVPLAEARKRLDARR